MGMMFICKKCGFRNPETPRPKVCQNQNPKCGEEISLKQRSKWVNETPDEEEDRTLHKHKRTNIVTTREPTVTEVILRFPGGTEIAVRDRLNIGRFDPDTPDVISNWDPVSKEVAHLLQSYDTVSRNHAEIRVEEGRAFITHATTATNKTTVTGADLPGEVADVTDHPFEFFKGMTINCSSKLQIEVIAIRRK
jgi:pSer/pThr/pTyr-binding forkhead associated (FHA) protein